MVVNLYALELAALVVVGSLAYLGASFYLTRIRGRVDARLAVPFTATGPQLLVEIYLSLGLLLPFLNGYLVRQSWIDCLVVSFGTLLGTLAAATLMRRPPDSVVAKQFYLFGTATVLWPIVGVARAVSGFG